MPCVGWLLGASVGPRVARWDHWIAFALLTAIGVKTLREAFAGDHAAASRGEDDAFRPRLMFGLAIATSIDALAAGVTLPMLDAPFWLTVTTIGAVTASLCVVGLFAGRRFGFGALLGRRLDAAGGLVLIALAVKILLEHTL
jgi:putative Mn2+ efflux pump MntP